MALQLVSDLHFAHSGFLKVEKVTYFNDEAIFIENTQLT